MSQKWVKKFEVESWGRDKPYIVSVSVDGFWGCSCRVEDENGIAVQVSGRQALIAQKEIDTKGQVLIEVKYLNFTENGKLRMPTCKEVKA